MARVKGPFNAKWGANELVDVSEISLNYEQNTNDYSTIDGRTFTIDGGITASVSITLLSTDVAALAVVFPQYYVPNGGTLSTGEIVTDPDGAIDIKAASCDTEAVYEDLDIEACGSPSQVFRLKNARTRIDSMDFADSVLRTITVQFVGEPDQGEANIQFFKSGSLSVVS